jgi:hypothetical protein
MKELYLKCTAHPPFNLDIAPSEFFLFSWLKRELASWPIAEIDKLFHVIGAILRTLTIETVASVFSSWIERLKQIINTNDDYIWYEFE